MAAISGEFSTWLYNNKPYSVEGSLPFELGKSYPRRDGKMVKIIGINTQRGYETIQGDDAEADALGWRYNRDSDRGRCTGSLSDDPHNLLPDFAPGSLHNGKGFFIKVSMMGANKSEYERNIFRQMLNLEHELTDIRYAAKTPEDWKAAYAKVFTGGMCSRFWQLCEAMEWNFTWCDPDSDYDDDVRAYTWAVTEFLEDKRAFYSV
jgi:hypothetical protein